MSSLRQGKLTELCHFIFTVTLDACSAVCYVLCEVDGCMLALFSAVQRAFICSTLVKYIRVM